MKNILHEKPDFDLHGRMLESVLFVKDKDLKGKSVLDIGCGFGWSEVNFLERGVKKIVGTEISKDDLRTAKKYVKNKKASFVVGEAGKLPFKANSFDTIVSWEVIEHIPKNSENVMFAEVNRVLKKGGVFYLSTPYKHAISNLFDPAWWLIGHRHYSKDQLKSYAKNNSFKVEKIMVKGKFWQAYSWLDMYVSKWIFRRSSFIQKFLIRKIDAEYQSGEGYANIFVKYKKV